MNILKLILYSLFGIGLPLWLGYVSSKQSGNTVQNNNDSVLQIKFDSIRFRQFQMPTGLNVSIPPVDISDIAVNVRIDTSSFSAVLRDLDKVVDSALRRQRAPDPVARSGQSDSIVMPRILWFTDNFSNSNDIVAFKNRDLYFRIRSGLMVIVDTTASPDRALQYLNQYRSQYLCIISDISRNDNPYYGLNFHGVLKRNNISTDIYFFTQYNRTDAATVRDTVEARGYKMSSNVDSAFAYIEFRLNGSRN